MATSEIRKTFFQKTKEKIKPYFYLFAFIKDYNKGSDFHWIKSDIQGMVRLDMNICKNQKRQNY